MTILAYRNLIHHVLCTHKFLLEECVQFLFGLCMKVRHRKREVIIARVHFLPSGKDKGSDVRLVLWKVNTVLWGWMECQGDHLQELTPHHMLLSLNTMTSKITFLFAGFSVPLNKVRSE